MKLSLFELLLSAILSATFASGATVENSTSCGGILHGETGFISYHRNEAFQPNETCVWLIRSLPADASNGTSSFHGYRVHLLETGFQSSLYKHPALHVKVLGYLRGFPEDDNDDSVLPSVGEFEFQGRNILVITFESGSAENSDGVKGFHLRYEAGDYGTVQIPSPRSTDQIFGGDHTEVVNHPARIGTLYDPREMSTLLFLPTGLEYPMFVMSYGVGTGKCGGECEDGKIKLYSLRGDATWARVYDRHCIGTIGYSRRMPVLLVFESASERGNYGFQVATMESP